MMRMRIGYGRSLPPLLRFLPIVVSLTVLALSPATRGVAQRQGGQVDIEVEDTKGKGIAEVKVTVVSKDGELLLEGTTNKKGKFKGSVESAGTHVLRLEKAGFGPVERDVEINDGVTMSGTLRMLDEAQYRKAKAVDAFNAGVTAIQSGKEKVALARFSEAAEYDPSIADAHRMVAAISLENGDVEGAAPAVDHYLELKGLDAAIAPVAYEVFRVSGDARKEQALTALQSAGGTVAEDTARRVFNAGVAANRAGDREGAIAAWQDALSLDPSLGPAHQSLAALSFNGQDYETALRHVEHLLELQPEHKEGLRMGFWCHVFLGQEDGARDLGARWLAADPEAAGEIVEEVERQFEENRTSDSLRLAQLLVDLAPDYPRGHYALGRVQAGSGNIAEAKVHLQRFLELAPSDPEASTARQMLQGL